MPCTTILVGKNASYNGSTLMARNEDSGGNNFTAKKFIVVKPDDQPRKYVSVISKVEIDLPDNPMQYTCVPNALDFEGIWGEAGFNTKNVAMSATETITSNPRVYAADPLEKGGIGEEDLVTIVLPYINSAKEGVTWLGSLLEKYGTYEMNAIGFQDENEIWWFESIGGHHYIAKRVPDDSYVVGPNQQGIDYFDFKDAFGEQKNCMCSKDMIDFIINNNLDMSFHKEPLSETTDWEVRPSLGSHSDSDVVYNTCRAWYMARTLNPNTYKWDGEFADYTPESENIPWCFVPEHKINIEDIKYVLSSHYQGTEYDVFNKYSGSSKQGKYRPIGINRNNFVAITEIRPNMPKEISAVLWIAMGSNIFNSAFPFYANINDTPDYLKNTTGDADTNNLYWANRLIAALSDANYQVCKHSVEVYGLETLAAGHLMLKEFDKEYLEKTPSDVREYLEGCNQKVADYAKEKTTALLNDVLYNSSLQMKCAFKMSDA